jgi:hypothetical protein
MNGLVKIGRNTFVNIFRASLLSAFILTAHPLDAIAGVVLITTEEAKLPTPKGVFASRAITRGPRIDLAGPDANEVRSPLRLQLKFRGFGGAKIDLESLRVTYLKMPNVDLTSRVRAYAKATGIKFRTRKRRRVNIWFASKSTIRRGDAR